MTEILTLIEKTAFLKSLPESSTIPTEAIAELASRAREIHCEPGQVLFREGDPDQGSFIVIDGSLELRKGTAIVLSLKRSMGVGELWHDENRPHEYTLITTEHSHVLNLTREDVIDAMLDYPELAVEMLRTIGERFNNLASRVLELEATISRLRDALRAAGVPAPDPGSSDSPP
jgi:CRP-like cAMP-binding protein